MITGVRAKFHISGLVQGVGFRYFVYKNASLLGIKGFVKNNYDGSVEVKAEGDKASVETLHNLLKQGPYHSRVEKCNVQYEIYNGEYTSFEIR